VPWGDVDALATALRAAVERRVTAATAEFARDVVMDRLEHVYAAARRAAPTTSAALAPPAV
jgi:hypothetical protein